MATLTRMTGVIAFASIVLAAATVSAQSQRDFDICKQQAEAKTGAATISASPDTTTAPDSNAVNTSGTALAAPGPSTSASASTGGSTASSSSSVSGSSGTSQSTARASGPQGTREERAEAAQDGAAYQLALRECLKARGY